MAKWEIKGVVENESKTLQETEQAVLDSAVEKGEIEPESAGQETEEVPVVNLDQNPPEVDEPKETTEEQAKEKEPETVEQLDAEIDNSPLELIVDEPQEKDAEQNPAVETKEQPPSSQDAVQLPENVDKLVKFMEETGGSVEDYINLNRDLDSVNDGELLREYYKQSKPWDSQEIEEYLEDNFSYDEELDEPKDVRSKKRAFKEELFNAKKFLQGNKEKYYAELKLKRQQEVPPEYQEAFENYSEYQNRVKENQKAAEVFLKKTDNVFNNDFKGFDFQVGDNKYRFKVSNAEQVKNSQSDINNFISDFLNEDGFVEDATRYHKALFTAKNADKLAEHFYEQGRADAIRQGAKEAKNISMDPRQEGVIRTKSGQKFKAVSGSSSSKLKIKLNK